MIYQAADVIWIFSTGGQTEEQKEKLRYIDGDQEEVTEKDVVVNNKISSMLASRTRKLTNVSMPKAKLSDSHIFRHSAKGLFPGFKVGMKEVEEGVVSGSGCHGPRVLIMLRRMIANSLLHQ